MQRNFGIGSPLHDEEKEKDLTDPKYIGTEEHPVDTEGTKEGELATIDVGEKKGYNRITDEKGDFVYYMPKMTAGEKRIHESGQ